MIRFQTDFDLPTCNIDPVTITGLALGALAGGGAALASGGGGGAPPAPQAPPAQAAPQQNPVGQRQAPRSQQPSFVGASAAPDSSFGQKTLLGQ